MDEPINEALRRVTGSGFNLKIISDVGDFCRE